MQRVIAPVHAAVLHVLAAPQIDRRTAQYLADENVDFDGLLVEARTMSGGEALLVRVARDLWTAERTVGLADVVQKLDARSFTRVVDALRIARRAYAWDRVETIAAEAREEDLAA